MEVLHGLVVTESFIQITVTSTGCTEKKDFEVRVQESLPPVLTFFRVNPDPCDMAPHLTDIQFSRDEAGGGNHEFEVANRFQVGPSGPGK